MNENHSIMGNLFPLFKAFNSLKIRQKMEKIVLDSLVWAQPLEKRTEHALPRRVKLSLL